MHPDGGAHCTATAPTAPLLSGVGKQINGMLRRENTPEIQQIPFEPGMVAQSEIDAVGQLSQTGNRDEPIFAEISR